MDLALTKVQKPVRNDSLALTARSGDGRKKGSPGAGKRADPISIVSVRANHLEAV
jgi:hypothetical protein